MQIGMVGLGRMGANMARRLLGAGHACVVHDIHPAAIQALAEAGARGAASLAELAQGLEPPRIVWLMLPAAAVDATIEALRPHLQVDDVIVDGGNSHYRDDLRRAAALAGNGLHYVDVGTSGGVWGLDNGYCLMIGGEAGPVQRLEPVFAALAPGPQAAAPTPGRDARHAGAERGWLHCGPSGAGHFVKMVHNGIEYGLMAAYAEGFDILRHAGVGSESQAADAETAPLAHPEAFRYDFDLAEIAELWRRGSVVRSWLLDLTAHALLHDPGLDTVRGQVADSGEGRWTLQAAIDVGVPAPVLATALFARFGSRGRGDFANRILSAMRREFGGHEERQP
ncbi:MAG: decarboxylating 6-phosphogluconate dehydrogenase [Burkholderiales bacterium]|nr:decarboxylating 6-phosphogluconate dehydrogenase [Burkholderiales bacterium]OJX05785.1 MAG: 6-phosphogluconate dehydrogenase (decarboxylating) [Burkholderiales bacterium 70-64]